MRSFLRAIAAVLRGMPTFIWKRVKTAGGWVSQLVAVPAAPTAPVAPDAPIEASQVDEEMAALRGVAACMLQGQIPSAKISGRIPEQHFRWLCACSDAMLQSILRADDQALRDHVRGRKNIRGVLANDPTAIADYERAMELELARERDAIDETQQLLGELDRRYSPC